MEKKSSMKPKLAPTLMHNSLYQNLVKDHEHHYEDKTMENLPLGRFYNHESTLRKKIYTKMYWATIPSKEWKKGNQN